ncbi:hypothetical protein R1sor_013030 [Riccia sorocarpa]|uniref:Uncharacterized protein n=1 Tax=Riccia sorocarpa TaxID=122646 RepID=A0ABD3H782_9MARC
MLQRPQRGQGPLGRKGDASGDAKEGKGIVGRFDPCAKALSAYKAKNADARGPTLKHVVVVLRGPGVGMRAHPSQMWMPYEAGDWNISRTGFPRTPRTADAQIPTGLPGTP